MAVNRSRNMRAELEEGLTDGAVMKLGGGMRGGEAESLAYDADRRTWPHGQQLDRHYPSNPAAAPH